MVQQGGEFAWSVIPPVAVKNFHNRRFLIAEKMIKDSRAVSARDDIGFGKQADLGWEVEVFTEDRVEAEVAKDWQEF